MSEYLDEFVPLEHEGYWNKYDAYGEAEHAAYLKFCDLAVRMGIEDIRQSEDNPMVQTVQYKPQVVYFRDEQHIVSLSEYCRELPGFFYMQPRMRMHPIDVAPDAEVPVGENHIKVTTGARATMRVDRTSGAVTIAALAQIMRSDIDQLLEQQKRYVSLLDTIMRSAILFRR